MKTFNWPIFFVAIITACSVAGVGIGLAERSSFIVILSIVTALAGVAAGLRIRKKNFEAESRS
ncbi:DUF5325 family protein [Alteribacter natronophilus]|uniref:DUF5325 family protein n=1 Tax=Alteribacter natronophilus TaxID=2583810 RepID=UPI00110E5C32|nr:DUF5325 family protein [Alteribacter natronophilus]TMW73048.1 hypothetical protein FGB90_01695 [Alteribacter natronophilus]